MSLALKGYTMVSGSGPDLYTRKSNFCTEASLGFGSFGGVVEHRSVDARRYTMVSVKAR